MTTLCRTCRNPIDARTLRAGGEVCFDCATTPKTPEVEWTPPPAVVSAPGAAVNVAAADASLRRLLKWARRSSYVRKTRDVWNIEQHTAQGWEVVCAESNWREAREQLKAYRANQPEYPVRARKTRERIEGGV